MPVAHFNEGRGGIVFPVSDSISNHNTFQLWNVNTWFSSVISDILVDSLSKLWYINTSIWFSWNVKIIVHNFWELLQKIKDSLKVIISCIFIVPATFGLVWAERKSYISWTFKIENISLSIPWIFILNEVSCTIFNDVGSMFLEDSKHWWASWTSIEP